MRHLIDILDLGKYGIEIFEFNLTGGLISEAP